MRIPFYEIRNLDVHQKDVTVHAKADYTIKCNLGDFKKELDDRTKDQKCSKDRGKSANQAYQKDSSAFFGNTIPLSRIITGKSHCRSSR